MDPTLNEFEEGAQVHMNLFRGLYKFDQSNNLVPAMAEGYTLSEDETVYTFTLRDDGTQLPAMTLNFGRFTGFVKGHLGPISKITKAAVRVHTGLVRLRHRLNVVDQQHQFTPEEQQFLNTLFETGDALITALLPWRVFDLTYLEDLQATAMVSLQQAADNPNAHLRLVVGIASTTG